jgi:hypothetical protein
VEAVVDLRKALAQPALEAEAALELMRSIGSRSRVRHHTHALWEQAVRAVQRVVRMMA